MSSKKVSINVPVLARVEGEGALEIEIRKNTITDLKLRIFEPPRLFEKFLEGKHYSEVPDIVARICGICPVAYQMSAVSAFETLFNVEVSDWVQAMRRLFYCGEWLESHALHIHLLAAPDFFGYNNVADMAKDYPSEVKRGLALQELGNRILRLLGGRSVHPVGARVGGFYHAPAQHEVTTLLQQLRAALPDAEALLSWVSEIDFPEIVQDFTCIALATDMDYPMIGRQLQSSKGHQLQIDDYENYFTEIHKPHSTALFSSLEGNSYLVGPLSRLNLNYQYLPDTIQTALKQSGVCFPSRNMYHSMVARAVEIWFALLESIRLLENYYIPESPYTEVIARAGTAYGCSEAPRGILWHRYEVDKNGIVKSARIVPPTSQNQARIEEDLHFTLSKLGLEQADEEIRLQAEKVIRNYDPCISCATHFLKLDIERR